VSKGQRNRAKRREEELAKDGQPDLASLIAALSEIHDSAGLEALAAKRPELFGDRMLRQLEEVRQQEGFQALIGMFVDLVRTRRVDPDAAWRQFEGRMSEMEASGSRFEGVEGRIRRAILDGEFDRATEMAEEAFAHAERFGLGLLAASLHEVMSLALIETAAGDRASNVDAAIERADAALPFAIDEKHYAQLTTNLALMFTARKNGDPAENVELAIAGLRTALEAADESQPSDLVANIQTNLAHNLDLRHRGDRSANLAEARDLCLRALEWRSPERNAVDWAYTEINLGSIYDHLAELGEDEVSKAEASLRRVIDEAERVATPALVGHAHASLGAVLRRRAEVLARREREVIGPGELPPPSETESALLAEAKRNLDSALALLDPDAQRETCGRALQDLGAVLEANGDVDGAIDASRRALSALAPDLMPTYLQRAGWRIGRLSAHRGDWESAAEGFMSAVDAFDVDFNSRLETPDRDGVAQGAGNLARWAAFALARTGQVERAIVVLENGRTRELRRRLGRLADQERLNDLPHELRRAYEEAGAQLAAAPLGSASDEVARNVQEVVSAIRTLPGFQDFATGATWADVSAAVESDWPLLYVNPTPEGTVLFYVADRDGVVEGQAIFLDVPTSHDLFMTLTLGALRDPESPVSYLATAGGISDEPDTFTQALEEALPAIGAGIGRPVADLLERHGSARVTLIPCGPIGLAPIHSAAWDAANGARCLLDSAEVRYAPSATMQMACIRRAEAAKGRRWTLVALGNSDLQDPELDLSGSEAEVDEILTLFGPDGRGTTRGDATATFLREHGPDATHLHLACHGRGGLIDAAETGLALADGWLSATEIADAPLKPRLTVLSACQTAIPQIGVLPDEVLSLSTVFLAAGSACTVATLWSVDDAATALLMCKMYERLKGGSSPPESLRHAQLWLRDLDAGAEADFLASHPALEAEFRRRTERGNRPGRALARSPDDSTERRFKHPRYWAPFVAVGA
jgi:CHAT domain-containing protein/tetratricopeptide (TPR) repeat protein